MQHRELPANGDLYCQPIPTRAIQAFPPDHGCSSRSRPPNAADTLAMNAPTSIDRAR